MLVIGFDLGASLWADGGRGILIACWLHHSAALSRGQPYGIKLLSDIDLTRVAVGHGPGACIDAVSKDVKTKSVCSKDSSNEFVGVETSLDLDDRSHATDSLQ